jgi:riboflavin biosynthesis pyrimidine reductase
MADAHSGTRFTLLNNAGLNNAGQDNNAAQDNDAATPVLTRLYAYPAHPNARWVRSNFISSLDGGATADGKSAGLAGPGDKELFGLMRELADVVVVGAGTVRIENYGGAQLSAAARQGRRMRGQDEVPPIAIVTQSGRLDRDMMVFTKTEVPPLVLTCTTAAAETTARLGGIAEVIDCSGTDPGTVDLETVLTELASRGLRRVLTEGGPRLHSAFIEDDLLDELCLSLAPILVGGQARRIATGPGQVMTRMRRAHLLADDAGYLYARYVRQ